MAGSLSATSAGPRAPRRGAGYQPALDGVRGVAIVLVVLFHYPWGNESIFSGGNRVAGGFLGVDAFFVLSGFLITTLLLQEHSNFGGISLRNFYARRALRLLPALAVLFVIALVLHFTLDAGNGNRPSVGGLLGMVFYVANWVNIYRPKALGVVSDTWSLAIEEQFYLVWPVLLVLMLRKGLRLRTVGLVTLGGIALAAIWRAWYWHHRINANFANPYYALTHGAERGAVWNRIYFGSDTRADTLLAGCLTAIVLIWLVPRLTPGIRTLLNASAMLAIVVAAVIVTRATVISGGWLPRWGFLLFTTCVAFLIAGLVAAPRGVLALTFSLAPLAWIGRRSYAIYLFHQLVYAYGQRSRVAPSPQLSFVFRMAVIAVVAEASHRLVEAPILRYKDRFGRSPVVPN